MNVIKNLVGTAVSVAVTGAAWIIGTCAAKTVWENGLEYKVRNKAEKWFSN